MNGKVFAISISKKRGIPKTNVDKAYFKENWGIEGDAHAGETIRQVSILSYESIEKIKESIPNLKAGAFAENVTTVGFNLMNVEIGSLIEINDVILEITQIGKECHKKCAIFEKSGDCVMPREGVFAKVLKGGVIKVGDKVNLKK